MGLRWMRLLKDESAREAVRGSELKFQRVNEEDDPGGNEEDDHVTLMYLRFLQTWTILDDNLKVYLSLESENAGDKQSVIGAFTAAKTISQWRGAEKKK